MTTDFIFGLVIGALGMLTLGAAGGFVWSILSYRRLSAADAESDWWQPVGDWPRDPRGRP